MFHYTQNFSLKNYNTFGISALAKHFLTVYSGEDLLIFFEEYGHLKNEKRLFLGTGSNLLFINDFDGLVIHPVNQAIRLICDKNGIFEVEVDAGVKWDHFVNYCVDKGWCGVENLSLIPGNMGAAPVQNIGAYGIEVESVITKVKGFDINLLEKRSFSYEECKFSYRTSVFKEQLKDQFLITSVVFQLSKKPKFHIEYGLLETEVNKYGETNLQNIRKAVIAIRESKLPDPLKVGNAGSFFKNPVVSEGTAEKLKNSFPDIPQYRALEGKAKLSAGWLIEKAGWKGRSIGNVAVHEKQALVIINLGQASGQEIFDFSELVAKDVLQKFGIKLEREVQLI